MRIITGKAKGCKLKAPKGMLTRPTADRVKESLFNILGAEVLEAKVLDLFAGTGNLGLEALSRGAVEAVFVDQNAESISIIKENAAHTKLIDKVEMMKSDVFLALRRLSRAEKRFDLLFCDPPYSKGLAQEVLSALDEIDILADGAVIVVEHDRKDDMAVMLHNIVLKRSQTYGSTVVSFFIFVKSDDAKTIMEG